MKGWEITNNMSGFQRKKMIVKPSKLAAKMYKDYKLGNKFTFYTNEEIMLAHNIVGEMIVFFAIIHEDMTTHGLTSFECHLASILSIRGKTA